MLRSLPVLVLVSILALSACRGLNAISDQDTAGTPTVYAKVLKEPNPLLMGHWRRIPPSAYNHPWIYDYILVKKGDKYAVYYFYDSRNNRNYGYFSGWTEFTINGDTMSSGQDGAVFYVKDGEVYMQNPSQGEPYHMQKVE